MKLIGKSKALSIGIFIGGVGAALMVMVSEPERENDTVQQSSLAVEISELQRSSYRLRIPAWGYVEPREFIEIHPQVSGMVNYVSQSVFSGALITTGDHLFHIEEKEYHNRLQESLAKTVQIRQALEIEKGKQAIARQEYLMLENTSRNNTLNKELVLRLPQLKEKEALLKENEAKLAQSQLDYDRTRIVSPCTGVILDDNVAVGQVVAKDYSALRVGCTEKYHIPAHYSSRYTIDLSSEKVEIEIQNRWYTGSIKGQVPYIHPQMRQKMILVELDSQESLLLNSYASLFVSGQYYNNAFLIPKEALRRENTVWLLSDSNTLMVRKVEVIAEDRRYAVVLEDLEQGDRLILSHIAQPIQGMVLHTVNDENGNEFLSSHTLVDGKIK